MKTKRTFSLSQKGKVLAFCLGEKTKAFMPTSFLARAAMTLLVTMLTATTAWADAVTLSPDNDFPVGTSGHYYVNMPKSSNTDKLTLADASIASFKVYDDGGKNGNYSDWCGCNLVLTAPEGYVLQLSGNIMTEFKVSPCDFLSVYDSDEVDESKTLLYRVSSPDDGTKTTITTVSTGQSMTLRFVSNSEYNYAGLDLTVTLVNPNAENGITVNAAAGGSFAANMSTAKFDDVVTLTATPSDGYLLSDISVVDAFGNAVAVNWDIWSNSATFKMPASAATVTPTFNNDLTNLCINMPWRDKKTANIPAAAGSIKVYDDGGATGDYSKNCDDYLTLTAPAGYMLRLSGNITAGQYDYLTVYDGSTYNDTKLFSGLKSTSPGVKTDIPTVTSSGQSMTLYFYSSKFPYGAGLDLTVTLVSTSEEFGITVNDAAGGSVVADMSKAKFNDVVTLTATPSDGYLLSGISVVDAFGNGVEETWNVWTNTATFKMPASAVTVTPTFTNDLANLSVNMPKTGTKSATIPAGVTSIKVYDDGGADGNYSYNCSGYLVLTAPTGYVLQLSGNITTDNYDCLTVYDGNNNSATQLLNQVCSTSDGDVTAITTVTSTGGSMTLYFRSGSSNNYDGLDLTVTLISAVNITWWLGSGTEADPYMIYNKDQLDLLAHCVNGTNGETANDYSGIYFKLGADIEYDYSTLSSTESNYEAIGDNSHAFAGHFDGDGHTISGIRIYKGGEDKTTYTDDYQGLFGKISSTAEVKNVTLADATITGYKRIGGIVGYSDKGTITGCHVLSNVTFPCVQAYAQYHGGIVGYNNEGIVTGCTSAAAFTHVGSVYNTYNIGGIVGYNQYTGTVSNCLYLGTTLQGDHYVGAIVGYNNQSTVTNCYYTSTDIHGKDNSNTALDNDASTVGYNYNGTVSNSGLAHKVTLGTGVTLGAAATEHGPLTVYGSVVAMGYNDGTSTTIYSTEGSVISLGYTVPAGYTFGSLTATAGTISGNATDGYTLTMPAADVTVTALLSFTYIDENGVEQTHAATIIDGNQTNLPGGWYVVNSDVALTTKLNFTGDTHLILADGKTLSIDASGDSDPNNFYLGLSCRDGSTSYALTIYGQAAGTGKVTASHGHPGYATSYAYNAKTITINGGVVEATSSGRGICGSNVIINGGQIILAPSYANITADNITLGWRKPSDYIQSYGFINPSGAGTITITDGKVFTDGTGIYDNTTDQSTLEHLSNVTLRPCLVLADNASNADAIAAYNGKTIAVALDGRTLTKDGKWNTLCLPFDVTIAGSPLEGNSGDNPVAKVFANTSSLSDGGLLTLNFSDAPATIPAGTPFIIKWTNTSTTITNPVFIGAAISSTAAQEVESTDGNVKFVGQYSPFDITADNINEILYVASGNKIGYSKSARTLKCFRAHFWVQPNGTSAGARMINLDFGDGETTSLNEELRVKNEEFATAQWYTLDGRKLTGVPTQKGVYIVNGKKIIIK